MITLNPSWLISTAAGLNWISPALLVEDKQFLALVKQVSENATYEVAIESLCAYIQNNY
jgi:hypothetical protein